MQRSVARVPRRKLPAKIGDALTPQQYAQAKELGILVDKDDQVPRLRFRRSSPLPCRCHC
jgi:hypothetical protein